MNRSNLEKLLGAVRDGTMSIDEAANSLRMAPFEDLGFAKVDHHRQIRCGFPEVIYGEGKSAEHLVAIFERVLDVGGGCLATRVNSEQAQRLAQTLPDVEYDPIGRTLWAGTISSPPLGRIVVASAGTSDLSVAKEAETTARVMGTSVELVVDVGVAGLHRILSHRELLAQADCVVVVAGMEGALPSVVGGLVDCPVIAVPTSVGYGAAFGGVAALLGMLNSCAANVTVVNIDSGFCGGYVAALIARRAQQRMA